MILATPALCEHTAHFPTTTSCSLHAACQRCAGNLVNSPAPMLLLNVCLTQSPFIARDSLGNAVVPMLMSTGTTADWPALSLRESPTIDRLPCASAGAALLHPSRSGNP